VYVWHHDDSDQPQPTTSCPQTVRCAHGPAHLMQASRLVPRTACKSVSDPYLPAINVPPTSPMYRGIPDHGECSRTNTGYAAEWRKTSPPGVDLHSPRSWREDFSYMLNPAPQWPNIMLAMRRPHRHHPMYNSTIDAIPAGVAVRGNIETRLPNLSQRLSLKRGTPHCFIPDFETSKNCPFKKPICRIAPRTSPHGERDLNEPPRNLV